MKKLEAQKTAGTWKKNHLRNQKLEALKANTLAREKLNQEEISTKDSLKLFFGSMAVTLVVIAVLDALTK